jgi:hypothetical protein
MVSFTSCLRQYYPNIKSIISLSPLSDPFNDLLKHPTPKVDLGIKSFAI